MRADIKNRNVSNLSTGSSGKEVAKYNKNFIKESRAFGELGHPDGPTGKSRKSITHDNKSGA